MKKLSSIIDILKLIIWFDQLKYKFIYKTKVFLLKIIIYNLIKKKKRNLNLNIIII